MLVEDHKLYYLNHSLANMGGHTFTMSISVKMNLIERLEFELAVQYVSHYVTTTTIPLIKEHIYDGLCLSLNRQKIKRWKYINILKNIQIIVYLIVDMYTYFRLSAWKDCKEKAGILDGLNKSWLIEMNRKSIRLLLFYA